MNKEEQLVAKIAISLLMVILAIAAPIAGSFMATEFAPPTNSEGEACPAGISEQVLESYDESCYENSGVFWLIFIGCLIVGWGIPAIWFYSMITHERSRIKAVGSLKE